MKFDSDILISFLTLFIEFNINHLELFLTMYLSYLQISADPLNLDGVSFVRKLRGTLGECFDLSSDQYNGSLLYRGANGESDNGLYARSRRLSSNGHYVDNENGEVSGGDCPKFPSQHRPSLADVALQSAPDTPVNAARKLLADIFSTRETASLVYHNDVKVVIDVIIRQICDLPATSPVGFNLSLSRSLC